MNDLTKEELGIIACNLCVNPKTKDILRKLESMINNYCDHEWRKGVHLFNDIYCIKCSKNFEVINDNN